MMIHGSGGAGKPVSPPQPLVAGNPILDSVIGPGEIHLYESTDQHGNWLDCIKSRKAPIAPAEIGHRACSTCLIHHIAMKTKRKLHWDPVKEHFKTTTMVTACYRVLNVPRT